MHKDRKIVKYACFFMQICYNIDKGIHNYTCRYWIWFTIKRGDFYEENYTGYQFNSFKEILFQLDNLSHTVYHFDDYLDQVKIKLYDRVINDQTIEDTPFEKPLKKILHEAFQEAYDSYLKLEDYCQT